MQYPSCRDFTDTEGKIDWKAYQQATQKFDAFERDGGRRCYQCNSIIMFPKGYPTLCHDCTKLKDDPGEVTHDSRMRCPHCATVQNIHADDHYELYQEGEHEVQCKECEKPFEVTTHISFSFESPELEESVATIDDYEYDDGDDEDEYEDEEEDDDPDAA